MRALKFIWINGQITISYVSLYNCRKENFNKIKIRLKNIINICIIGLPVVLEQSCRIYFPVDNHANNEALYPPQR